MEPFQLVELAQANKLPQDGSADAIPAIQEAIQSITRLAAMAPLVEALAAGQKPTALSPVIAALNATGARLAPQMSPAQTSAWRDGVLMSLRNYTVRAARIAAQKAQAEPFKYGLGSVDARLHELAQEVMDIDRAALLRLRAFGRAIRRAQEQKSLPAPEERDMTVEEIAATPDAYVQLGRKLGYISDEDYQAAMALRAETDQEKTL